MRTSTQQQCHWADEAINATYGKRLVMATGLFRNTAKGNVWYGSYTDRKGKRRQFSTRTKNERDARRIFIETLQKTFEEEDKPKLREITLSSFTEEYLVSRRGEQLSPKSLKAITQSLEHFQRALGDKLLHTISVQLCERFLTNGWRSEGWRSLHVPRRHYENLRCALDAAKRWQYIRENPFAQIKKPKPVALVPDVFNRREFQTLFESLPDSEPHERRFRNLVVLASNTGLRLGELRFLERRDIDFNTGLIRVRFKDNFRPKSKRERSVPLSVDAVRAIRLQLDDNANSEYESVRNSTYLFPNKWGFPLSENAIEPTFKKQVRTIFPDRHRLTFHSLRHSYASFLAESGVSMQEIQKILGHASIRTTEIYARIRQSSFVATLEALNSAPALIRPEGRSLEAEERTEWVLEASP